MAKGGSDSGGAGAAVFGLLFLIALVITYWWFFLAVGAAVGLFFGVRALIRHEQERRLAAAREADELAYRADRQHRWARRGDTRGVYGETGAELMRAVSPVPPAVPTDEPESKAQIAAIAATSTELTRMIQEKPHGWRWAAFASVLAQRRAAVRSRLRDCELGFKSTTGHRAYNGREVAEFVAGWMDELSQLVSQVEAFTLAPAFMGAFGERGDERTADAEAIVHTAGRLMDYHERFLSLAEQCRDFTVPSQYFGLMRDCTRLASVPLDGYDTFIEDFLEFINDLPEIALHGRDSVEADPIFLHMDINDQLLKRISKQLKAAARG